MATVLASVDTNHGDMVRCVLLFTSNLSCTQLLLDVNVTDSRRATRLLQSKVGDVLVRQAHKNIRRRLRRQHDSDS
jgi:hypothetical protein